MWWHTRRNQISSFGQTDECILIGRGRQYSPLLAAEVCASAVVMLDTQRSEIVRRVLATHSILQFPLHFPSRASPCAITFQLDSSCQPKYLRPTVYSTSFSTPHCYFVQRHRRTETKLSVSIYTGCFKKSFTTLKAYRNLYRGHTQRFELSKCSKTHRVLPRIVMVECDFHW